MSRFSPVPSASDLTSFDALSYAPTILRWRAEQLRKETGDDTIQTEQERQRRSAADIAKQSLLRPLQMLFTEPIMICFSGYLCLIYGLRE